MRAEPVEKALQEPGPHLALQWFSGNRSLHDAQPGQNPYLGALEAVKAQGLDTIRGAIAELAPFLADRTDEILSFDEFKQLTVGVDRLTTWHKPGVLWVGHHDDGHVRPTPAKRFE